jgi:outer membrane protein insertion porin family
MIVLNLEVRTVPGRLFGRPFGIVGFMDGGNVFEKAAHINAGQFRGAVGFGLRYDSPLGPLRLDFGFKLDRHILAGRREAGWAWHLNLGEVF